jgi:hypothetical protein
MSVNLFHEYKIDSKNHADECREVVPVESLIAEEVGGEDGEHCQGDDFLNHLELHQREWTAIALESYAVGGYHEEIFKQGNAPREKDDQYQWPV